MVVLLLLVLLVLNNDSDDGSWWVLLGYTKVFTVFPTSSFNIIQYYHVHLLLISPSLCY